MESLQMQSEQIGELAKALAAAQAELEPASKNATNPHLRNRYADIAAVYDAIRVVLPKHGLAVAQTMLPCDAKVAGVRTVLMHTSGQWIAGELHMPLPTQGACGPQQMGSAITYARRYSLSAIVGVVSEDDDDAEAAQQPTRQQAQAKAAPRPAAKPAPKADPNQQGRPTKAQMAEIAKHLTATYGPHTDPAALEKWLIEFSDWTGRRITSIGKEVTEYEAAEYLAKIREAAAQGGSEDAQ